MQDISNFEIPNLIINEDWILIEGIYNNYDLGLLLASSFFNFKINEILVFDFLDYERLGKSISLREMGLFTDYGYIYKKRTGSILQLIQ